MNGGKPLRALVIAPPGFEVAPLSSSNLMTLIGKEASAERADLLILVIEADRGISQDEISGFNRLRESQIPAVILVTSLMPASGADDGQDRWDFDDIVMLINRTLEKVISPYLVLHDESGLPIGLYDLLSNQVINYSHGLPRREVPDSELVEIVKDFQDELAEENFVSSDFTTGLRVVAIPYIAERKIGIEEFNHFITMLQQVQP